MIQIVPFAAALLMLMAGYSGQRSPAATPQPIPQIQPPSSTTNTKNRVYLAGRRVSFVPPADFTAMTPEEITLKFPSTGNQPQYVYANQRRSVSVAITFSPAKVSPQQLPELKNFLPKFLEQVKPDIKWITQDFTIIDNVRWIQLEFISRAIDTNIHNDAYFTSFDGKMLGFNFNSTIEQYDASSAEIRHSRDSILISN